MDNSTYQLEMSGYVRNLGQSWDVRTKSGVFAAVISERFKSGLVKVYFNSNATKGSTRKFYSIQEALEFIHQRRINKGYNTQ